MKRVLSLLLVSCSVLSAFTQGKKSENIVVVTMDGLRWQEVFQGADSLLSFDTTADYSYKYIQKKFWLPDVAERRMLLMPFFWTEISKKGVLLGNRNYGNYFNNANPYWFSYPGYNEIFTGYPDTAVNSNKKIPNPNENVFEYLNKMAEFKGRIAVFGSWDVFSSIFNEARSGLFVNDGFRDLNGQLTEKQKMLNKLQHEMPDLFHGGERLDAATFNIAFEYMKANKPKLIFFGLGDTDEFAHAGKYDYYLDAAQKADAWIRMIWEYIQSTPGYKDKTTLIITTDHGRGLAIEGNWKQHGSKISEASEMWMAAIGPSVKATGESKEKMQAFQGQIAATIALILGKEFKPTHPVMQALVLGSK
ncbi:MAG TPA: alkaline phosphatase family protein [Chitinophagaceae bacterium]|nr:alkaline phosphatase family protein [Chitinophagaceae bacterium]